MEGFKIVFSVVLIVLFAKTSMTSSTTENAVKVMNKIFNVCENSEELVKCMKIQALKLTDRALKLPTIRITDGLTIIKKEEVAENRSFNDFDSEKFMKFPSSKVDELFFDRINKFMDSHQLSVNVPRLLSSSETPRLVEEGRKKMKKYMGPFLAALALKGGILSMVYHSIAIVAGKALIIGKIALVISAIIGLKKLVTPEGHDKTTYEIVKHPHVSNSHTYSSSSHGDFDGHDGQYHRSLGDNVDMMMQDRAYRGHK
ncbi:CLUMA_CG000818, isoform A [Clunio marinus]|uniref:CLUMA_CG000818, isoform A n=1 Tax=Clunio marinus TaxID=568069 RepID=A0A1J1HGH6_9DIPT|nr:CLUMA_CG000818, isoform A [Clunio marinus]